MRSRRRNAPSLQKLFEAGAIVIGKANMHELAFGITSTNLSSFAGPVKNPYDTTRIPGGSSGGTAAAIAAGIVTCGLGTDTGGSTRVPAALTGIVGLAALGRQWRRGAALSRHQHGGPDQPHPRHRRPDGPHRRRRRAAGFASSPAAPLATAEPLRGKRLGIPASFWGGLDRDLETVIKAARAKLGDAGVVLVEADLPGLFEQNAKVSFPVALHEPIADIPAYLKASGIEGITLADIAAQDRQSRRQGRVRRHHRGRLRRRLSGCDHACSARRCRRCTQSYFRDNNLDGILFPTTIAPAPAIDTEKGSGEMSINGGAPVPTFDTMIRNTDPGSNAGLPGLSLFAGMTPGGLPVGLEIDGPVGSDAKLLAIGLVDRSHSGHGAAAEV